MAIKLKKTAGSNVLEVYATGKIVKEDYVDFVPAVDRLISEFGEARLLMDLHDFHGWTVGAGLEDLKFDIHHFSSIERIAIVGESSAERLLAEIGKPFNRAEIRYFDRSQMREARSWIGVLDVGL